MSDVTNTLRQFILSNYLQGESPENLRDDTPLITSGILDSFAVQGVVAFVAEKFGVELDVHDASVERFNRIIDMAAAVERKQVRA